MVIKRSDKAHGRRSQAALSWDEKESDKGFQQMVTSACACAGGTGHTETTSHRGWPRAFLRLQEPGEMCLDPQFSCHHYNESINLHGAPHVPEAQR